MIVDRRDIAPMLAPFFTSMPIDATSDDWHGFLNAQTGLDVSPDEPNSSAFDKWRQALAEQGYPVWGVDAKRLQEISERGSILLAKEKKRVEELDAKLAKLAIEAPNVTAQDLMAKPQ